MQFRPNRPLVATTIAGAALLAGCGSSHSAQLTATVKPPARVAVPPVRGNDLTVATALLKKGRFRWRVQRRYSGQPAGRVLAASPQGGALVARGTEVALVVSRGAQPQPAPAAS